MNDNEQDDFPMPRWCEPQVPRRTHYKLDDLTETEARVIGKMLIPSNRRRAARERAERE